MGKLGILRVRGGWFYLFTGKTAVTAFEVVTAVFILRFHSVWRGRHSSRAVSAVPLSHFRRAVSYFVQFASDKFSTFALTSYEKVGGGHHGGTVTPVSVKSAPTGDAGVVLYIAMCAMSCIGSTALLCKRKEEA